MISPNDFDARRFGYSASIKPPPKPAPVKVEMPKPGSFTIIRSNGTVELHQSKPSFDELRDLTHSKTFDTVSLKTHPGYVMVVDDTGMIDERPPNPIATGIYHLQCKPGTTKQDPR